MQDAKNLGKAMQGQNTFQELFRKHFPKDDFCDCGSCIRAYLDELSEMIEREVIGGDEPIHTFNNGKISYLGHRGEGKNNLKAEQRTKLKQLMEK